MHEAAYAIDALSDVQDELMDVQEQIRKHAAEIVKLSILAQDLQLAIESKTEHARQLRVVA